MKDSQSQNIIYWSLHDYQTESQPRISQGDKGLPQSKVNQPTLGSHKKKATRMAHALPLWFVQLYIGES